MHIYYNNYNVYILSYNNYKKMESSKIILIVIFVLPFIYLSPSFSSVEDKVYPPDSSIEGLSYEEWGIEFWKWWINREDTKNIQNLNVDDKCFVYDKLPVLFLVNPFATQGSPEKKYECVISKNKPIFIVGVSEMCNINDVTKTDDDLKKCVNERNQAARVILTVDGDLLEVVAKDNPPFRFTTDFFNITIPENSFYADQGIGTSRALLDGIFFMLKPLSPGDHTIKYLTVQNFGPNHPWNAKLNVNYLLHVK